MCLFPLDGRKLKCCWRFCAALWTSQNSSENIDNILHENILKNLKDSDHMRCHDTHWHQIFEITLPQYFMTLTGILERANNCLGNFTIDCEKMSLSLEISTFYDCCPVSKKKLNVTDFTLAIFLLSPIINNKSHLTHAMSPYPYLLILAAVPQNYLAIASCTLWSLNRVDYNKQGCSQGENIRWVSLNSNQLN